MPTIKCPENKIPLLKFGYTVMSTPNWYMFLTYLVFLRNNHVWAENFRLICYDLFSQSHLQANLCVAFCWKFLIQTMYIYNSTETTVSKTNARTSVIKWSDLSFTLMFFLGFLLGSLIPIKWWPRFLQESTRFSGSHTCEIVRYLKIEM